jgi:hypothetical protein
MLLGLLLILLLLLISRPVAEDVVSVVLHPVVLGQRRLHVLVQDLEVTALGVRPAQCCLPRVDEKSRGL